VRLENKQGRLERIYHHLDSFREEGKMSLHKSQILFFAGKHLQQVCVEILRLGQHRSLQANGRLAESCDYAKGCLMNCRPRVLSAGGESLTHLGRQTKVALGRLSWTQLTIVQWSTVVRL